MTRSLLGVMGVYLLYAIAMVFLHPRFIYPFSDAPFQADGWEKVTFPNSDARFAVWRGTDDIAVLYFMGNAGSLAHFTSFLDIHQKAGRTIVAMEYPGGGGLDGKPIETQLKADALRAYDWLAEAHDGVIVAHGYSMGSGIALHVSANRKVVGTVIDAPYARMCELMARRSLLPACYIPGVQKWDSIALVPALSAPVLVQHGTEDTLIPFEHGKRLAAAIEKAGVTVTFHANEGAGHNDLVSQPGYAGRLNEFMNGLSDRAQ